MMAKVLEKLHTLYFSHFFESAIHVFFRTKAVDAKSPRTRRRSTWGCGQSPQTIPPSGAPTCEPISEKKKYCFQMKLRLHLPDDEPDLHLPTAAGRAAPAAAHRVPRVVPDPGPGGVTLPRLPHHAVHHPRHLKHCYQQLSSKPTAGLRADCST